MNSYPPFGLCKVLLKLGTHTILKVLLRCTIPRNPVTGDRQHTSEYKSCGRVPKMFVLLWLCAHNYHSCQSASCAVILSIWSTSMSRQTSSLAERETMKTKDCIICYLSFKTENVNFDKSWRMIKCLVVKSDK